MDLKSSRRKFIKTIAAIPAVASLATITSDSLAAIPEKSYRHKFKLSLNLYSFNSLLRDGKVDLFDMIDFCAENDFDAIDPTGYYFPGYPNVPDNKLINEFKRKAFLLGLDISGTGVRNDFANPDKDARKADIKMIKDWIEVAAKLGIPNLRVFAGTNQHEGFTRDQVFEWMAKDLKECCDYAGNFGVIIAIQNHNDFIKTADDIDRIFAMVDSQWLGQNLDIGSYRQSDPYKEIEQNIKYAVTWQIKENVWINGIETPTDYVKLFSIIKKAGYRGYLPLETLGEGDPFEKVPQMLKQVREALSQV